MDEPVPRPLKMKPESAPMLAAPWGPLAGKVAGLIRHDYLLARKLLLAPIRAFHAYAAFLQLDAPTPDSETGRRLLESRPQDLLGQVLPGGGSVLWRCLSLAGDVAWPADDYRRLGALANGPCAQALCTGGSLTELRIRFLECVAKLDPLVAISPAVDTGDFTLARRLDGAIQFLRATGGLEADGAARLALQRSRRPNIADFVRKRLLKLTAPGPNLRTNLLRQIRTGGELQALGRRLGNCLATEPQFLIQLAIGSRRFFEWTADPGGAISVGVMPNGFHWIEQVRHPGNGRATEETFQRVRHELAATGIRLLSCHPLESAGELLTDPELHDAGDDREPGDLAAAIQEALGERRAAA